MGGWGGGRRRRLRWGFGSALGGESVLVDCKKREERGGVGEFWDGAGPEASGRGTLGTGGLVGCGCGCEWPWDERRETRDDSHPLALPPVVD